MRACECAQVTSVLHGFGRVMGHSAYVRILLVVYITLGFGTYQERLGGPSKSTSISYFNTTGYDTNSQTINPLVQVRSSPLVGGAVYPLSHLLRMPAYNCLHVGKPAAATQTEGRSTNGRIFFSRFVLGSLSFRAVCLYFFIARGVV